VNLGRNEGKNPGDVPEGRTRARVTRGSMRVVNLAAAGVCRRGDLNGGVNR
jgi:hypothetical protein